jgi:hypothetical protein
MSMVSMSATLGIAPIGARMGKRSNARWPHRQVDAGHAARGRVKSRFLRNVPIIRLSLCNGFLFNQVPLLASALVAPHSWAIIRAWETPSC